MSLGHTFEQFARDYDAVRPGYPDALIEDIITHAELPAGARLVEVGCGAGQATLPFAQRGYEIVCLDIGAQLLAFAREKLRAFPDVQFELTSFEEWQPPAQPFDMLFSATAWHWIKPEIGYPKAARVLAPGGHIAIFTSHHPTPYTGFFAANAPILRSLAPELGDPSAPSALDDAKRAPVEWLARDGLFELVLERYYHWTRDYTSEQYIRLCNTYSSHINLQPERRERLHAALGELIDREFNGVVTRPYETALFLAKKR